MDFIQLKFRTAEQTDGQKFNERTLEIKHLKTKERRKKNKKKLFHSWLTFISKLEKKINSLNHSLTAASAPKGRITYEL